MQLHLLCANISDKTKHYKNLNRNSLFKLQHGFHIYDLALKLLIMDEYCPILKIITLKLQKLP